MDADEPFGGKQPQKPSDPSVTTLWRCTCGRMNWRHCDFCPVCGGEQKDEVKPRVPLA
jgi:hypothetical protein